MANQRALSALFNQISDMLLVIKNKETIDLSEEDKRILDGEFDLIEQQLNFFQKVTSSAIINSGLDELAVLQTAKHPDNTLKEEEKKILNKASKIQEDLEGLKQQTEKQLTQIKVQKRKKKTEGKNRKNKFKKLGGQGWMPL